MRAEHCVALKEHFDVCCSCAFQNMNVGFNSQFTHSFRSLFVNSARRFICPLIDNHSALGWECVYFVAIRIIWVNISASCQHIGSIFENLFIFTTDFFLLLLSFGRYWPHITPANKLQMGWCYVVSRVKITCTFMFMNAKKKQHSKSCVLFTIIANRECLRFGFRYFVSFFRLSLSRGSLYSVTSSFRSFTQI